MSYPRPLPSPLPLPSAARDALEDRGSLLRPVTVDDAPTLPPALRAAIWPRGAGR